MDTGLEHRSIIPNNRSHEMMYLPINLNINKSYQTVDITRNADTCKLKHIVFNSDIIQSISEFKNLLNEAIFELTLDNEIIAKYNFSFLMELNEVKKVGNRFAIKIPHDHTIDEIILIALARAPLKLNLHITNISVISAINLYIDYIYYDREQRVQFDDNVHNILIQDIQECGILNVENNKTHYKLNLHDNSHRTKGYFIEGDISKIKSFCIRMNGYDRFDEYDQMAMQLYCHHISDNLIYFSYTGQNNYKDMTLDSYTGSPDHSRLDTIVMLFKFDENINIESQFKIYSVSLKYLHYSFKFGRCVYVPTSGILKGWIIEKKELDESRDNMCSISHMPIETEYCTCLTCNNNFDHKSLANWISSDHPSCPMCRCFWKNNIKYVRDIIDTIHVDEL